MRKLTVFNFVTLNGYFQGPHGDLSWHKHGGEEEHEYAINNLKLDNILLFGRITYDFMASYWPTSMAAKNDPVMAKGMNDADKIVFSKTLKTTDWTNTTIMKDDIVEGIKKMKQLPGKNMTVLGSGSIITQFAEQGLIDEYQLMIDPVAIGNGTPIFKGINIALNLKLISVKQFKSGTIMLSYQASKD